MRVLAAYLVGSRDSRQAVIDRMVSPNFFLADNLCLFINQPILPSFPLSSCMYRPNIPPYADLAVKTLAAAAATLAYTASDPASLT